MEPPLAMRRGRDGIIRDRYGRPCIMVFDSKHAQNTIEVDNELADNNSEVGETSLLEANQVEAQPLEFVNVSVAAKEKSEVRTLIRIHVMEDYKRRKMLEEARLGKTCKTRKTQALKNAAQVSTPERDDNSACTQLPLLQFSGSLDPFTRYPVKMRPHMYKLVHHCRCILSLVATYSLLLIRLAEDHTVIASEITEPGWRDPFPLAMTDSAFFHMILLRSAMHFDFLTDNLKSSEHFSHKIKVIQLVSERLQNPAESLSDATIITIALLAVAEVGGSSYR
jgi:hypothetical protein